MTRLAVLIGTAKPMPTLPLPLPPVSICELTPMTWPCALSSGPPELPGLIGASVWMTLSMLKPLGAVIERCRADTTPVVSVRSRPNGLPIASVGSPTCTPEESPSVRGVSCRPSVGIRSSARSSDGSEPITLASTWLPVPNCTVTFTAPWTTCQFVRIVPFLSITMPDPLARLDCDDDPPPNRLKGEEDCCTIVERM